MSTLDNGAVSQRVATVPRALKPLGYEQITGLSSVKTLTVPAGAQIADIDAETKDVRWRDDGTDPSSTVGRVLTAGTERRFDTDLEALKFIESAASAKLNVTYYAWQ